MEVQKIKCSRSMVGPLMTTLSTTLWYNVMALAVFAVVDHVMLKPWLRTKLSTKKDVTTSRWFFVHAFANLLVCVTGARALYIMLSDPHNAMDQNVYDEPTTFGATSPLPLVIINSVHLYHVIGGFSLTGADIFHHMMFIPTIGLPGQLLPWACVMPGGAFFISGLPGGVSYFLLGLQKLGRISPMTEKRSTANLNNWVCSEHAARASTRRWSTSSIADPISTLIPPRCARPASSSPASASIRRCSMAVTSGCQCGRSPSNGYCRATTRSTTTSRPSPTSQSTS